MVKRTCSTCGRTKKGPAPKKPAAPVFTAKRAPKNRAAVLAAAVLAKLHKRGARKKRSK